MRILPILNRIQEILIRQRPPPLKLESKIIEILNILERMYPYSPSAELLSRIHYHLNRLKRQSDLHC
jgi:hypothetical protein